MKKEIRENIESILEVEIESPACLSPMTGCSYIRPLKTLYIIHYKNNEYSDAFELCKRPYKTKYPILKKLFYISKETVENIVTYINQRLVSGDPLEDGLVHTVTKFMKIAGSEIIHAKIVSKNSAIYNARLTNLDVKTKYECNVNAPMLYEFDDKEYVVYLWDMKKKKMIRELYYKDKFLVLPDEFGEKQTLIFGDFHKEIMNARFRIREDKNVVFFNRYHLIYTIPFGTYNYID